MEFILPIVLLAEFFSGSGVPAIIKYAPELCGIAASTYVVVHAVRHGFAKIRFTYWVLIALIALHFLFGVIVNDVQVGTMIVGGRLYLRAIPFFLLAITLTPSEAALRKQFFIILGIAIVQLPIAAYQKISNVQSELMKGNISTTGDWVTGTLGQSHFLSLFLICFSTILVVLYARKIISVRIVVILLLIVLAPTMINETKATFFLAPLALAIPMLAYASRHRVKNIFMTFILLIGFLSIFIPTYDYFVEPRWGYGLIEFFMREGRVEGYLDKGAQVGTTDKAGRVDSVSVAFNVIRKDATSATFGLGIGAVTESSLGRQYEGKYYRRYGIFSGPTYARLIWEIGFLGTAFVLIVLLLVFSDARRAFRQENAYGVIAHAYLAIIPIMILGMFYKMLLVSPGLSVCFWYYCGVIIATTQSVPNSIRATSKQIGRIRIDHADA